MVWWCFVSPGVKPCRGRLPADRRAIVSDSTFISFVECGLVFHFNCHQLGNKSHNLNLKYETPCGTVSTHAKVTAQMLA